MPEELEAERADRRRHPVQHEARAGDDAVAAFLLDARKARQELVGDVLAEARPCGTSCPRCAASRLRMRRACRRCRASRARTSRPARRGSCRGCGRVRVTSSHSASGVTIRHEAGCRRAVPHSTAFLPPAFIATLPPMHDASADVGIAREHEARGLGDVHRALGDHARAAVDRRRRARRDRRRRPARSPTAARASRC